MTEYQSNGVRVTYDLWVDTGNYHRLFTDEERQLLRPIAETLAMLDGNAFLTMTTSDGQEWYEQYLPEAYALFNSNGGLNGWAGECSWIRDTQHENPSVQAAYAQWRMLKTLSRGDADAEDHG